MRYESMESSVWALRTGHRTNKPMIKNKIIAITRYLSIILLGFLPLSATAQTEGNLKVAPHISTLGAGVSVGLDLNNFIGVRLMGNSLNIDSDDVSEFIDSDIEIAGTKIDFGVKLKSNLRST